MKTGIQKFFGDRTQEAGEDRTLAFIETADGGLKEDVIEEGDGKVGGDVISVDRPNGRDPFDKLRKEIRDRVVHHLIENGDVTARAVRDSLQQWRKDNEEGPLWRVLARHSTVNSEAVFGAVARIYAFKAADIDPALYDYEFARRLVDTLSEAQQEAFIGHRLLPLRYEFDRDRQMLKLVLASHDPTAPDVLKYLHDLNIELFDIQYAPQKQLDPILDTLFPKRNEFLERIRQEEKNEAFDIGATFESGGQELVDEEALDAEINRSSLINLFEAALLEAVRQGASDIHVFPNRKKQTEFHFRIDGELQLWHTQTKVSPEAMLAVVKDRCGNVDRFEREAAQDGYIQREVDNALIRFRVSVLPIATANRDIKAESIVIRVLDDRNVFSDLSSIGLLEGALKRYQQAIKRPNGMVIMTGPTGSGKSTTLVAALHQVIRPQVNVLTVEDPVEYVINGVRQIKLGTRLDLEGAMRAILRHDPDIVMVGEMRDKPTAELAIKLANTGHLTFSTLHTNDAPSAISRLYKMGIELFLIAYAINLIVAQRLLRKLCPECKRIDHNPDPVLLQELGYTDREIESTTFYHSGDDPNCKTCRGVGYKGRRAIGEALYFTREIRHIIVASKDTIDEDAIRTKAVEQGMLTLLASAREVVKMGDTSIEEVIRVTASDE
ncbi:MAG: GspE/PulE family protein [Rhodothermales bacterium]